MTTTISELMSFIEPEHREVLRPIIERMGHDINKPTHNPWELFPTKELNGRAELLAVAILCNAYKQKYAPRLNFRKRCEILALHQLKFTNEVLAKAYNVDRRTITHVYNPMSPHYKSVRAMMVGLGESKFLAEYATDEVLNKASSFTVDQKGGNNKYAKGKSGLHVVRGPMCTYDHRVYIEWIEAPNFGVLESGWYYRDLDGDLPDRWFTCGDDSLKNSQACYTAMLGEIMDKFV